LTDEQRRAYALAHNKTAEMSEWDFDKVEAEISALEMDMTQFGFEDFDDEETADVVEDEAPEIDEEAPPVTQLGDIWQLGRHRLMCGDSTDAASVALLMDGKKADICFTSPPYNAGQLETGQEATKRKYNDYDDNMTETDYFNFIKENVRIMLNNATEVFYNIGLVENNKRAIIKLQSEFIEQYKDVIYWKKSTVAPHIQPGVINNLVEFIICFGNGKRKFENAQFSQGTYWNVIEGANASGNEYAKIHKATFPIYLPENIIKNFSPKHGNVIDCFGGTGTTLIACEQLDRTCYTMELDPKYCDVIVKRWETLTGEKAVRL
jgi:site-specific DNA-methyltransferase (adenine-specific)